MQRIDETIPGTLPRSLPPLRLLLYLEWLLLGMSCFTAIVIPSRRFPTSPWLSVLCVAAFGILGLRLPNQKLIHKIIYTAVEFLIILLPAFTGNHLRFIPLLGLIAVIRACQMFGMRGRSIVASLVLLSFVYITFLRTQEIVFLRSSFRVPKPPPDHIAFNTASLVINNAISFGLAMIFVLLLVNALLSERRSRQELAIAHEQLRQYALRIENQATLQERNRIAREIHDSLGHALTAQSIQLENALLFLSSNVEKSRGFITEAKQLGSQALREVRQSVATLRADPLQGQSLETAIVSLVRDYQRTTNIAPDCNISLEQPVSSEIATAIYRIVQEALMNIRKHSDATKVTIQLQSNAKKLYLLVEDNGKGFNPEQNTTGFGLHGMRERTVALNGKFRIVSLPGKGCQIQATIPLLRSNFPKT